MEENLILYSFSFIRKFIPLFFLSSVEADGYPPVGEWGGAGSIYIFHWYLSSGQVENRVTCYSTKRMLNFEKA